jgi:hypothetical protein
MCSCTEVKTQEKRAEPSRSQPSLCAAKPTRMTMILIHNSSRHKSHYQQAAECGVEAEVQASQICARKVL